MKTIFTTLFIALAGLIYSQEANPDSSKKTETTKDTVIQNNSETDTMSFKIQDIKVIIVSNDTSECDDDNKDDKPGEVTHWEGFTLGFSGLLTSKNSTAIKGTTGSDLRIDIGKSISADLNLFERSLPIAGEHVKLISGLGFRFTTYGLKHNVDMVKSTDSLNFNINRTTNYAKNRLYVGYVHMPLMLALSTHKYQNKGIKLAAGAELAYRIGSNQKVKYSFAGKKVKDKTHSDYFINTVNVDLAARLTVGKAQIFARKSITPLFDSKVAPDLYSFTVGVRIIGFND